MSLSSAIEAYIRSKIETQNMIELSRNELANKFNCVPSQINYVISTRFIPELGFYVESRRGGNGYIKISKIEIKDSEEFLNLFDKIGNKMSQSVVDIYLKDFLIYNVLNEKEAKLIKVAVSDKSLKSVEASKKDNVRADIFKNLLINLI
ncbi:transcriptional repressor CtsR [Clostridium sp. CAG:1219]|nr:transcriptional repressor CtsR [Clostridium sp. CAG:1219]